MAINAFENLTTKGWDPKFSPQSRVMIHETADLAVFMSFPDHKKTTRKSRDSFTFGDV